MGDIICSEPVYTRENFCSSVSLFTKRCGMFKAPSQKLAKYLSPVTHGKMSPPPAVTLETEVSARLQLLPLLLRQVFI